MGQQRGGVKLRRTSKKKGRYDQQRIRTASNKARRARKRAERKAYWNSSAGKIRMEDKERARSERRIERQTIQPAEPIA